jgi:arginyl-tRNA synthetase
MQELKDLLKEKIKNLYNIELEEIELQVPPKKELGDFSFSPFILAKELKKSPVQISNELMEELNKPLVLNVNIKGTLLGVERYYKNPLIESLNIAGPYLNIKVSNTIFKTLFLNAYESFFKKENV